MAMKFVSRTINGGSYNKVRGNQLNNSHNTTTIIHGNYNHTMVTTREAMERTIYDEFEYIKLGQVIPLETLCTEDLSELELSYRSGRMIGRVKTRVTTRTVAIGQDKDSKLVALMYEGEDAQKVWEHDFQWFSVIKSVRTSESILNNSSTNMHMKGTRIRSIVRHQPIFSNPNADISS
ncbi:hypothetical protein VNI00_012100 [Paramarasmius palmivorus]|uniref:Uncharacterized protein n=1 Tax=Paramarasmius palmivorus TaxID=297713 RepID=A0AAW0C6K1_9AGAR